MDEKNIDMDKTLFELTEQYPDLIDVLFEFGFMGVKDPAVRKTHGKKIIMLTFPL